MARASRDRALFGASGIPNSSPIFWLKDDALDDPDLLPRPDEIAAEIVENLDAALHRFRKVALSLQPE